MLKKKNTIRVVLKLYLLWSLRTSILTRSHRRVISFVRQIDKVSEYNNISTISFHSAQSLLLKILGAWAMGCLPLGWGRRLPRGFFLLPMECI